MNKINFFSYFKILILTIVIALVLMVLVSMIPRKYIRNNVIESSYQIANLGEKSIVDVRLKICH